MSWSVLHSSCSPGHQNPAGCEPWTICQSFQIGQATLSGCFVPMSRVSALFPPRGRTMFLQKASCTAISPGRSPALPGVSDDENPSSVAGEAALLTGTGRQRCLEALKWRTSPRQSGTRF